MKRFAPAAVLLALFCVGCKPPCTNCPNVAGTYLEMSAPVTKNCDGDTTIWSGDTNAPVTVTQNGSQLTLTYGTDKLTGTLYDDSTASFSPASITVEAVSQDDPNPEDGTPEQSSGTLALQGAFFPGNGTFAGAWNFIVDDENGCGVWPEMSMSEGPPDAGPTD